MEDTTSPAPSPADVRAELVDVMAERRIPGMQVAVVRDRRIVLHETFGVANVEHDVPVTPASVFSINSMSKAFTGVAVMQLVEVGLLELDAPVSHHLDELPESWRGVTVRQLATLTSGLPEMMVYHPDMTVGLIGDGSAESAWLAAYAAPLEFAPGQGYAYVQTNYALLGRIIDRLTGMPFTEFVTTRQLAVAGMTHTRYADDSDVIAHRADTYMSIDPEGGTLGALRRSHLDWPDVLKTGVGMHSTAGDLAEWVIALQRGELLTESTSVDTLCTPIRLHDGRPGVWGIGWIVAERPEGRVCTPGGGGKAQITLYPDGIAVIVLTNLIGAFPEHLAVPEARSIELPFIDRLADHFRR